MKQDTNREYLRKLLDFLRDRILSNPDNQWFAQDLYKLLAPVSDARISDIHEQCIESILQQQANEFYKDFVIADLRPQLIADFVKMEHWRRRNDIYEFSLAMFQQVECIMNYIGRNNSLSDVSVAMMSCPCYVEETNSPVCQRKANSTYSIGQLLFINTEDIVTKSQRLLSEQWTKDKFKIINYFVCHQACLTNAQFMQFTEDNRTFAALYALRNRNHRGNELTEREVEPSVSIESNPSRGFLVLTSFLVWFIDGINKGFPISKELINFSKNDFSGFKKPAIGPKIIGKIDLPDTKYKRNK